MSFHWENIVWQNADGTWGIGFYERISRNSGYNEDYDPEWDDEYDYEHFAHAANGFRSADAAIDWWHGANPGSHNIDTKKLTVKQTKDAADMVRAANDPAFRRELDEKREKAASLAFVKTVREKLRANEPVEGKRYNIRLSLSAIPSSTGLMQDHTATLAKDGDWLGFESTTRLKNGKTRKSFIKVWNTKTRSQNKNIVWVEALRASQYNYRY